MLKKILHNTVLKKQLFCFFLFLPNFIFCQTKIIGLIKDSKQDVISGANIILKKAETGLISTYTTSNITGEFELLSKPGSYILKISYLGYKTINQNISITTSNLQLDTIVLAENNTELEEIILKAENNGIVQKGDVTQYKIDKFLNGTEESLKDIITKLPGLGINESGKITANGKEIDRLLIDGENLYKSQHQLATENISSEMVKNAELIRNYKDFESITPNSKTGLTALNINIKDEFKNKFTGHVETHVGIEDKYKIKGALFNFGKKVKFSLLPNSNNLGETTMTIQDYYTLTDTDAISNSKGNSKVVFSKLEDLPRFLNSSTNVASKTNNFIALSSIINPSEKTKIDVYGIINHVKQEETYNRKLVFNDTQIEQDILENYNILEKNFFGTLQLKSIYKPSTTSVFTFLNALNIDNTDQEKRIENTTNSELNNVNEFTKPKKTSFQSNLSFNKTISSNLFSTGLSFKYLETNSKKDINATDTFLDLNFDTDFYTAKQKLNTSLNETNFNLSYTLNYAKASIELYNQSTLTNSKLYSNTNNLDAFYNKLSLNQLATKNGIDFDFKISKTLKYTIGINYNYLANTYNSNVSHENFLGLNSAIKAQFSANNIADLTYTYSNKTPTIHFLNDAFIIKDYRTLIINEDVLPNALLPFHQISASHFIFKPKAKLSYIFNASYTIKNKSIGNNIINTENVSVSKNKIINKDNMFSTFVFLEKSLNTLPLAFSGSLSYSNTNTDYFQESTSFQYKNENISSIVKLKSNFKNALINFDLGYKFSKTTYNDQDNTSSLQISQPSINLNGKISAHLFWYLESNITSYNNNDLKRNIYNLSPRLRYKKAESKWEFYITGNNILNLDNNTILENNSSPSYYEERTSSILSGYILVGSKFRI
ncbi:carboxypeptidase-like regulatory domain-containing protein [uncultured Formosa sp.]|uniref:carboxypeptidase-like regulatory domain-containing protein n=1 Tax=uncultured Formosa sp. TaxID=255435 RepID=UPI0026366582|nr:carboxypeptidase-like regulatory domain-containing protein [uncultured Formosa sp.]